MYQVKSQAIGGCELTAEHMLPSRAKSLVLKQYALFRPVDLLMQAAIDGDTAFVEWRMGLKIKGIEFLYPGTSRLRFGADGRIVDHRDYFDFVGPTFGPVPLVGGFVRWLYKRFVA